MTIRKVSEGVSIVDIPEAGLSVLCACPENAVKFLFRDGTIRTVTENGVSFETGPNAILLSETPIQNGRFSNLAEFPVLQMLYRQGLIVPGYPKNTGARPMLIGLRDQVEAQARYIYAGNYGITDPEDLEPNDIAAASAIIRMKKRFSFGAFKSTERLLELKVIDGSILELRAGAFIRRLGLNRYEFIHAGDALEVDLNLAEGHGYEAPYALPRSQARRGGFSVIHLGEGDGWDPDRPCMGSVVVFGDEYYLVDAGPNILESLDAIGLSVGDLAGVFHTHVHDDHFVGLTSLMRSDSRLAYYAVPMVRRSATEKLNALCGIGELDFARLFDVRDMEAGVWNDVGGLGVMPIFSPHPLETTILRFRASGPEGERTYAHYADLSSFKVIDSMVTADGGAAGITAEEAARAKAAYLLPADIKKVDVGGGMIHGDAADFAADASADLLLSHGDSVRAFSSYGFGRVAAFGERSVLIPPSDEGDEAVACRAFRRFFPGVHDDDIAALAACPRRSFSAGEALATVGAPVDYVFLTLGGSAERYGADGATLGSYDSHALVGAIEAAAGLPHSSSYRARRDAEAVAVPAADFARFVSKNGLRDPLLRTGKALADLSASPFFGHVYSMPCLFEAAAGSSLVALADGEAACPGDGSGLFVLVEGVACVSYGGDIIEEIGPGGVFGEESIVSGSGCLFSARARGPVVARIVPSDIIAGKPSLLWRCREALDRRLAIARSRFAFAWRPEYSLGIQAVDDQHRGIIDAMDGISSGQAEGFERAVVRLAGVLREHFAFEEALQASVGYPGLREHEREHGRLLKEMDGLSASVRGGKRTGAVVDFMKDCFIRHTLVMDRRYLPWMDKPSAGKSCP